MSNSEPSKKHLYEGKHKNSCPLKTSDSTVDSTFSLPPMPPNPFTNCAPSCDLSVTISKVAPKFL